MNVCGAVKDITGREGGCRVVFCALWSICYLCSGRWKPSLSLVKHDARPQPSARRWLKFTLWSSGGWGGGGGSLRRHSCACRSKWAERSWLSDPHSQCLIYLAFYLGCHREGGREGGGGRSSFRLMLTDWRWHCTSASEWFTLGVFSLLCFDSTDINMFNVMPGSCVRDVRVQVD